MIPTGELQTPSSSDASMHTNSTSAWLCEPQLSDA